MGLDGLAEADVAGVVGMQAVVAHRLGLGFGLGEVLAMLRLHGEEAGVLIEVDARHSPILAGLAQDVHILLDVEALHVGEVLVGLHIELILGGVAEVGVGAMDRRHHNDLLRRIVVLEPGEAHVDAAAEGRVVHAPLAMTGSHHLAVAVADGVAFGEEPADGDAVVIVVGACPDEDGIDGGAVGLLHQLRLLQYLVPLVAASGIDARLDTERIAQVVVVVVIGGTIVGVGHRIAQKGATLALPLCHAGYNGKQAKDKSQKIPFHVSILSCQELHFVNVRCKDNHFVCSLQIFRRKNEIKKHLYCHS